MPRNKKKAAAAGNKLSEAVQVDSQLQSEQLPPEISALRSSSQPLPEAFPNNVRAQDQEARDRGAVVESEQDSGPNNINETHRDVWKRVGFYTNHPNHNPTAKNEAYIKSMMEKSNKLGKIVAKYRLFLNQPTGKRTMLMQYPNRRIGQEYRAASGNKPLEIRIKPKCGLVEVDIPVRIHENYDKEKGIEYGEAMHNSRLLREGGSFGLAGGFKIGPQPSMKALERQLPPPEGTPREKLLENFDDANNKGHVMNKITLGGRIYPVKNGDPIYMSATFKEDICTWARLDAIVQLRPQFSHLDAIGEAVGDARRIQHKSERHDIRDNAFEEPEAKAVNMAVKTAEGNEEDMYGGMKATAQLLRDMRDEQWQRLTWIDQDEPESYEVYNDALVYQDPDNAPHLVSEMTNEQYLEAISCPRIDPIRQGQKVMAPVEEHFLESESGEEKPEIIEDTEDEDDEEEDEEQYETLPKGAIRPDDCVAERRIERIARAICIHPVKEQAFYEDLMIKKHIDDPKWAKHTFLLPGDRHHTYYKYRIAENRAGRGIDPEYDTFETAAAAQGRSSDRS